MMLLKYLHIICAKKLDASQAIHYQSKMAIATAQAAGATNPVMSQLLYILYIRDFLQTIQTSQTLQRHDSWTLWNFLEIVETNEFHSKGQAPPRLILQIKTAASNAFRVFTTETSLDLQLFFLDYYLGAIAMQFSPQAAAPVAAPVAGTPATPTFLQEELTEGAQPSKPFLPMMMMSNPMYFQYFSFMMKMYSKYMVFSAAQSLNNAAQMDLYEAHGHKIHGDSTQLKRFGVSSLHQWVQIRYFLVYLDFMTMFYGAYPQSIPQGHAAAAASNLVQTDAPETVVHETPVIENQVPQVPAPVAEQVSQLVEPHQSVVG
jgi:hypothetical protein